MYGSIYSHLNIKNLSLLAGFKLPELYQRVLHIYFYVFGYPEIAGQFRYPLVTKYLNPQPGEMILDAGCGNGIYANTYGREYGCLVTGIDLRPNLISLARKIAMNTHSSAKFFTMDASNPNFSAKSFDKIFCIEVLEHIPDDTKTLKNFSRLLNSEGILVLSVPRKSPKLTPQERHELDHPKPLAHVRSGYTPSEIKKLSFKCGLKLVSFTPYYHSFAYSLILLQQLLDSKSKLLNLLSYPLLMLLALFIEKSNLSDFPQGYVFKIQKP